MLSLRQTSEEDVFQFISLVRDHPCIWDNNNHQYPDRGNAEQSYFSIAQKMGMTAADAEARFHTLRAQYTKCLGDMLKSNSVDQPDATVKPPWRFFDAMEFLRPHVMRMHEHKMQVPGDGDFGPSIVCGDSGYPAVNEDVGPVTVDGDFKPTVVAEYVGHTSLVGPGDFKHADVVGDCQHTPVGGDVGHTSEDVDFGLTPGSGALEKTLATHDEVLEVKRLIALIREHPCIWQQEHPYYHERSYAQKSFASIAQTMGNGMTAEDVRKKYKNLRTHYSKKLIHANTTGIAGKKKKIRWRYFHDLKFLLPYMVHKTRPSGQSLRMSVEESSQEAEDPQAGSNSSPTLWMQSTNCDKAANVLQTVGAFDEAKQTSSTVHALDTNIALKTEPEAFGPPDTHTDTTLDTVHSLPHPVLMVKCFQEEEANAVELSGEITSDQNVGNKQEEKGSEKGQRPMDDTEVFRLISLVRMHPCIWDANDDDYHNRKCARKSYAKIAKLMGRKEEELVRKFKNLRTHYGHVLHSTKRRRMREWWKFFSALSFLRPQRKKKPAILTQSHQSRTHQQTVPQPDNVGTPAQTDPRLHPHRGTNLPGTQRSAPAAASSAPDFISLYFNLDAEVQDTFRISWSSVPYEDQDKKCTPATKPCIHCHSPLVAVCVNPRCQIPADQSQKSGNMSAPSLEMSCTDENDVREKEFGISQSHALELDQRDHTRFSVLDTQQAQNVNSSSNHALFKPRLLPAVDSIKMEALTSETAEKVCNVPGFLTSLSQPMAEMPLCSSAWVTSGIGKYGLGECSTDRQDEHPPDLRQAGLISTSFADNSELHGDQTPSHTNCRQLIDPDFVEDYANAPTPVSHSDTQVESSEVVDETSHALQQGSGADREQRNRMDRKVFPYSCRICAATFRQKSDLVQHRRSHLGEKRFFCEICGNGFTKRGSLRTHMNRHKGIKPFACKLCPKAFSSPSDLKQHEPTHVSAEDKKFVCKICDRAFASLRYCKDHEIIHTGVKPFQCDLCGQRFARRRGVVLHRRTVHMGEKSYKCMCCEKRFSNLTAFRDHKQTHKECNSRPFVCTVCGFAFMSSRYLQKHRKIHSGFKKYVCDVCGKKFYEAGNLRVHMRVHTGEKPCICQVCGEAFRWESCLNKHMESCK
ncbi:hypothetical protein BaRGS_00033418 [Batillaria attramentaria]|uniref:MADF domain-containing protein n=1 Tax=Batillaria attramentaria TaxID=370345 RepID=A0ABD0JJZ7_9CAEN